MCLAVPAEIKSIDGFHAWVDTMGVKQKINIQLIDSPAVGQYILVHAGFAIEKIDPDYFSFLCSGFAEILESVEGKASKNASEGSGEDGFR